MGIGLFAENIQFICTGQNFLSGMDARLLVFMSLFVCYKKNLGMTSEVSKSFCTRDLNLYAHGLNKEIFTAEGGQRWR